MRRSRCHCGRAFGRWSLCSDMRTALPRSTPGALRAALMARIEGDASRRLNRLGRTRPASGTAAGVSPTSGAAPTIAGATAPGCSLGLAPGDVGTAVGLSAFSAHSLPGAIVMTGRGGMPGCSSSRSHSRCLSRCLLKPSPLALMHPQPHSPVSLLRHDPRHGLGW
jgi:hypothetical protein